MRFNIGGKDDKERIAHHLQLNEAVDTIPTDIDKRAFDLRLRQREKELAHSNFRHKSFSTVDKLNTMYENDTKIMDCEMFSKLPKKRINMALATKKY